MVFKLETIIVGILKVIDDLDQGIASVLQIIFERFDMVFILFISFCRRCLFLFSLIIHCLRVKGKSTDPVRGMHHFCGSKRLQKGIQKVAKLNIPLFTGLSGGCLKREVMASFRMQSELHKEGNKVIVGL